MNGAHASVAVALAANTPCACRLGVSFFSMSVLFPEVSVEFLESLLTHLIGLTECELSCTTSDAPAPAIELPEWRDRLLQLRVLRLRLLQDRDVRVSIFPQGEEILIAGTGLRDLAL